MLKFYVKLFNVMGKGLSGKLSCMLLFSFSQASNTLLELLPFS